MNKAQDSFTLDGHDPSEIDLHRGDMQEMFLPIHNYVELFPEEVAIINLPVFQRLRRCRQLGFAHLLFPGATHTRFEHSIGTLYVSQRIVNYVNKNFEKSKNRKRDNDSPKRIKMPIEDCVAMFVRLAALLHDIGHVPFGHTLEDELNHLDKHDGPVRINRLADDLAKGYRLNPELNLNLDQPDEGWTLKDLINQAYNRYLVSLKTEKNQKQSPFEILELIIAKPPKSEQEFKTWTERIQQAEKFIPIQVCQDIVGNTICADFLDYLFRDWYHLGKSFSEDPRIYHYMEVSAPIQHQDDRSKWEFVINVGDGSSIRHDAITNILELLEARYKLAETVLFHRTKLSATALLDRCLLEIRLLYENCCSRTRIKDWERKFQDSLENALISGSDDALPEILRNTAFGKESETNHPFRKAVKIDNRNIDRSLQPTSNETGPKSTAASTEDLLTTAEEKQLMSDNGSATPLTEHKRIIDQLVIELENREIFTKAYRYGRFDFRTVDRKSDQNEFIDLYKEPKSRWEYLANLETMCEFPPGSVIMYCALDPKMNAKLASVKLLIGNKAKSFKEYEDEEHNQLTGDALQAQINRFETLWGATIYVRRDVWCQLSEEEKYKLEGILENSFLPISGDSRFVRGDLQPKIDSIREKMRSCNLAAARGGVDPAGIRGFASTTFPNGLPVVDVSDS